MKGQKFSNHNNNIVNLKAGEKPSLGQCLHAQTQACKNIALSKVGAYVMPIIL